MVYIAHVLIIIMHKVNTCTVYIQMCLPIVYVYVYIYTLYIHVHVYILFIYVIMLGSNHRSV